jgi:hypothetical protein
MSLWCGCATEPSGLHLLFNSGGQLAGKLVVITRNYPWIACLTVPGICKSCGLTCCKAHPGHQHTCARGLPTASLEPGVAAHRSNQPVAVLLNMCRRVQWCAALLPGALTTHVWPAWRCQAAEAVGTVGLTCCAAPRDHQQPQQ